MLSYMCQKLYILSQKHYFSFYKKQHIIWEVMSFFYQLRLT